MAAVEVLDKQKLRPDTEEVPCQAGTPQQGRPVGPEARRASAVLVDWTWADDPAEAEALAEVAEPPVTFSTFLGAFAWARLLGV